MLLSVPIMLLFIHFVGDFILQSNWMALNKSKNWIALLCHTIVYSLCFIGYGMVFVSITFLLHTLTDAITSRITSKLWQTNQRHWFFVAIGADQLLHYIGLAATFAYIGV